MRAFVQENGTVRAKCRRCRGLICVNRSGVFRKHNMGIRNGLGNPVFKVCPGSGVLPRYVLTDLENRRLNGVPR